MPTVPAVDNQAVPAPSCMMAITSLALCHWHCNTSHQLVYVLHCTMDYYSRHHEPLFLSHQLDSSRLSCITTGKMVPPWHTKQEHQSTRHKTSAHTGTTDLDTPAHMLCQTHAKPLLPEH
jgi:hypothetical protein